MTELGEKKIPILERLQVVFGENLLLPSAINYAEKEMKFVNQLLPGAIIPMVLQIDVGD